MASRRRNIPESIQNLVRYRAGGLCEYCHTDETWQYVRFTIDHIVALSQGGTDEERNLALACFHCNRRKSNLLVGVDPESGNSVALFHPRNDSWAAHFAWSSDGAELIGVTPIGRATVEQLQLNRTRIVTIRLADVAVGRHPPDDDPILPKE